MKKGVRADNLRFLPSRKMIRPLSECPVKSLGKIFSNTLRDVNAVGASVGDLGLWLARMDRSGLLDRFKA